MRACGHIAIVLLLAELAAGCANKHRYCEPNCVGAPVALDCQPVERQALVADISLVSYRAKPGVRTYCNLPEKDAQCLAAAYAPNARLLEQEAEAIGAQPKGHHRQSSTETTQAVLRLQAVHERNRNASAALLLLFRIAGSETAADNLRRQLDEVNGTYEDLRRLQAAGLDVPLSPPETESQQVDVRHKLGELELTIDPLNEQLANLLGGDLPPGSRFWPDIGLKVDPAVPVVEEAQMIALAQRADLAALRVGNAGGVGGLEVMRTMLGQTPGLGLSSRGCKLLSLLHFRAKNDEAAIREEQLQAAVADKERAIRHEVAQAVATLEARLNQIALAERRLEFLGDHREGLRRKAEVTPAATFEVRKATLAVLVAQQDLFHDVIEWKVAVVKLREAQGELAIECGYTDVFEYAANCCP